MIDRYEEALAAERKNYNHCLEVHDLPPIFHYWSTQHLRPKLQPFGFESATGMFAAHLQQQCGTAEKHRRRLVSLGSGNCDLEISLALELLANSRGFLVGNDFLFECCDLNPIMLQRGREAADALGIAAHFEFVECDLNAWKPMHDYDAVLANQSLHHIVNLEGVFEEIERSLRPSGSFLISDMIGRNGHQRWPEALAIVREFWRKLPPSHRFNHTFGYYDESFEDWDCSVQGFEGVRSQDILPLLLEHFHFPLFVPFGNVIDPFVDRSFGRNFDPESAWDRAFIDEVHQRDERELASRKIKPTHLLAVAAKNPASIVSGSVSPGFCVRTPDGSEAAAGSTPSSPYQWHAWPHDTRRELEIACGRLGEAGAVIRRRTLWALTLERDVEQRTEWGFELDKEIEGKTGTISRLQDELRTCTAWALDTQQELKRRDAVCSDLQSELEGRSAWVLQLQQGLRGLEKEVEQRTGWALELERQLQEKIEWSEMLRTEVAEQSRRRVHLEREMAKLLRNPLRLLARIAQGLVNRIRSCSGC